MFFFKFKFFFRGTIFLSLIFFCININASGFDVLKSNYSVFYKRIKPFKKWLRTNKNSIEKDIFIQYYHLPSLMRKFKYKLPVELLESFYSNQKYIYLYIEAKKDERFKIVFSGIKQAKLLINGAKRGVIELKTPFNYALVDFAFKSGVYFVLIEIDKLFNSIPVLLLSNKKLNFSQKRGFTLNSYSRATIYNITKNITSKNDFFGKFYKGFCFPEKTENANFFFHQNSPLLIKDSKIFILEALFFSCSKKYRNILEFLGFKNKMLRWWQESFRKKRICSYEKDSF
jgi:hypothetical protein